MKFELELTFWHCGFGIVFINVLDWCDGSRANQFCVSSKGLPCFGIRERGRELHVRPLIWKNQGAIEK